jgi:hypothetical protein
LTYRLAWLYTVGKGLSLLVSADKGLIYFLSKSTFTSISAIKELKLKKKFSLDLSTTT